MKQIQKKFDLQISFKIDNKIEKHEFNLKHKFFINATIFFYLTAHKKNNFPFDDFSKQQSALHKEELEIIFQ